MKILSPGPTSIDEKVLEKMVSMQVNPDLDPAYEGFQRQAERKISQLLKTEEVSFLMLGEGMLGLEAAIMNFVEPGDRVLVLSNGIFGAGFADFVEFYGGQAVLYEKDWRQGLGVEELAEFLKEDSDFKCASLVHCETPTGITNDIHGLCNLLQSHGILTIVDSVSGMGGEEISFDEDGIDVCLGGSQKCISAPTGLTLITLSARARQLLEERKEEVPSYYMNFKNYYNYSGAETFPYTMSEHLTAAFDEAMDQLLAKDSVGLHRHYAQVTRELMLEAGFELYAKDSFSNTVTCVMMPEGIAAELLLEKLREQGVTISKGLGPMAEEVFRIGHMGHNISYENFLFLFEKMDQVLLDLGIPGKISLKEGFVKKMKENK